jgi:hypothetical protein
MTSRYQHSADAVLLKAADTVAIGRRDFRSETGAYAQAIMQIANQESWTMLKPMLAACGLLFALVGPAAQAQSTIDFSKITCDQFMGYKIINPTELAMWLSGYYNGQHGTKIIDTEKLSAQTSQLQGYCLRNPEVPIMQAIDTIFHK